MSTLLSHLGLGSGYLGNHMSAAVNPSRSGAGDWGDDNQNDRRPLRYRSNAVSVHVLPSDLLRCTLGTTHRRPLTNVSTRSNVLGCGDALNAGHMHARLLMDGYRWLPPLQYKTTDLRQKAKTISVFQLKI